MEVDSILQTVQIHFRRSLVNKIHEWDTARAQIDDGRTFRSSSHFKAS